MAFRIGMLLVSFLYISSAARAQDFLKAKSTMSGKWELEDSLVKGNFIITPYKPVYFTAGRWSSSPNRQPMSENPDYSVPLQLNYNNYEVKFQLSLKTKVVRGFICRQRRFMGRIYTTKPLAIVQC